MGKRSLRRGTPERASEDIIDNAGWSDYTIGMEHALPEEIINGFTVHGAPCAALQRADAPLIAGTEIRDAADYETDRSRKNILCKTCGNPITSDDAGIVMNGSHEHTFMNPGGMIFRIGCFSKAGGCHVMGLPTDEYTWFPGFLWCCVICAKCLSHLGWHYRSAGGGFFGLILDQLARE